MRPTVRSCRVSLAATLHRTTSKALIDEAPWAKRHPASRADLESQLIVDFYNPKRRLSSLAYLTPDEFELLHLTNYLVRPS